MTWHPVQASLPGAGMIAVLGRPYETLTDGFIQDWMFELARTHEVSPDYLLVSQEIRSELHRIVQDDLHLWQWAAQHARDADSREVAERYPNKITGKPLCIVVFPGLPAKVLFVASLLEMRDEKTRIDGLARIVTRTYAGIWENKE